MTSTFGFRHASTHIKNVQLSSHVRLLAHKEVERILTAHELLVERLNVVVDEFVMWHVKLTDEDAEFGFDWLLQVLANLFGFLGYFSWQARLGDIILFRVSVTFVFLMHTGVVVDAVEALCFRVSVGQPGRTEQTQLLVELGL